MNRRRVIGVSQRLSQQEAELITQFRRNTPASRDMIVQTTKTSADMFHEDMAQAIADIGNHERALIGRA